MVQHFSTVLDFLDSAGQGLENLLDPGLEQLKIPVKDVVEILENKTEDGVFSMVSLD